MRQFVITASDPKLQPMFTLVLHESLITGLTQANAILPGRPQRLDGDRLREWADGCENPTGQKAALARAIAELSNVCEIVLEEPTPVRSPGTFWDAVAQ